MKELKIKVREMTPEILSMLEAKDLVRAFKPTERMLRTEEGKATVEKVYETDAKFGSHMLIAIGFNKSSVEIATHSDNEDFLLIDQGDEQKPLILLIALHKRDQFIELIDQEALTENDLIAVRLVFNDPRLSFFTMNGFTPHCEWTIPGAGAAAIFYVTEPNQLDQTPVDMKDYAIKIVM